VRHALVVGVIAWIAHDAAGDDLELVHIRDEAADHALPAPVLVLDPLVRPNGEGLGDSDTHHRTTFDVPGSMQLVTDTVERYNELDVTTRGWRVEGWLHRDLGFARLSVGGALENIQSRDVRGTYYELGAAVTRVFRLSRWNTAWISLSLGKRKWLGVEPPPSESDGTQVMLTIGTTFR
jgi:hypothetical protein